MARDLPLAGLLIGLSGRAIGGCDVGDFKPWMFLEQLDEALSHGSSRA
jgi:hypothetical protein